MKIFHLCILIFLVLLFHASYSFAKTWYIKSDGSGDAPTIQAGIDSAVTGDIILLASGTYTGPNNKNIDFEGKAIVLESESGANVTIIDCENNGRGFYFHSGEDSNSVLKGIKIINGNETNGGAILCINSSPVIKNNIIQSNKAQIRGGGIYCYDHASPSIVDNIIQSNQVGVSEDGDHECYGGGISCRLFSSPKIINNTIEGNSASIDGFMGMFTAFGGGISNEDSSSGFIYHNSITGNSAYAQLSMGGTTTAGGAIYCSAGSDGFVYDNHIDDNNAGACCFSGSAWGGSIFGGKEIIGNVITGGYSGVGDGIGSGGAIYAVSGSIIMGNIIKDNTAWCSPPGAGLADIIAGDFSELSYNQICNNNDVEIIVHSLGTGKMIRNVICENNNYQWRVIRSCGKVISNTICNNEGVGVSPNGNYCLPENIDTVSYNIIAFNNGGGIAGLSNDDDPLLPVFGNDIYSNLGDSLPAVYGPPRNLISDPMFCPGGPGGNSYFTLFPIIWGSDRIGALPSSCVLASMTLLTAPPDQYYPIDMITEEVELAGFAIQNTSDLPCRFKYSVSLDGVAKILYDRNIHSGGGITPELQIYDSYSPPNVVISLSEIYSPDTVCVTYRVSCAPALDVVDSVSTYIIIGPPIWEDVTAGPLGDDGYSRGVAWGDYDNDSDLDIYVSNITENLLLQNNGNGSFERVDSDLLEDSEPGRSVSWADYDNDGDLDLYLANIGPNKLFQNQGGDGFKDATPECLKESEAGSFSGTWVDFDRDGHIDLYVVNADTNHHNKLFRNNGEGSFSDVTPPALADSMRGVSAAWGDYDNDGLSDLYLANWGSANRLFHNDGGGSFTETTPGLLADAGSGEGVAWGDYDNDGDLDLYLANYASSNKLFENVGNGNFIDATSTSLEGPFKSRGVAWADYDNDGDLDLFISGLNENRLLKNCGDGTFVDATSTNFENLGSARGAAWGDYDDNGFLDLYVAVEGDSNRMYRNTSTGNHWIHINLIGQYSNASAIGARVRIVAGGISQIREISGGEGYFSQNSLTAEFGLGSASSIDTLEIHWPVSSGNALQRYIGLSHVDRAMTVYEFDIPSALQDKTTDWKKNELAYCYPNPFNPYTQIKYFIKQRAKVSLTIYNVKGQLIKKLVDEVQSPRPTGFEVMWDGKDSNGNLVATGVYFCRLRTGSFADTHKIVFIK